MLFRSLSFLTMPESCEPTLTSDPTRSRTVPVPLTLLPTMRRSAWTTRVAATTGFRALVRTKYTPVAAPPASNSTRIAIPGRPMTISFRKPLPRLDLSRARTRRSWSCHQLTMTWFPCGPPSVLRQPRFHLSKRSPACHRPIR